MRLFWCFWLGLALMLGCGRKSVPPAPSDLLVRDDSNGMLFTWIDAKGEFHVEGSAREVPFEGRDFVRVVELSREDGTHDDRIFIADLRNAKPDGTYPVRVSTRAELDKTAESRRAKHGAVISGTSVPQGSAAPHSTDRADAKVIVYGASWCGACHEAAAYLKRKGIPFVEKDIEADSHAQAEMQEKLRKAGLSGGSIPVIDAGGQVMIGFSAQRIERALASSNVR